jgi:Tol biopolymer transport system component
MRLSRPACGLCVCAMLGFGMFATAWAGEATNPVDPSSANLLQELRQYPHKLIYESNRDGNWELYVCNADGSNPVNLTRTPDVDELFPRPSPDGSKICFVADEGTGNAKVRNLYYMNADGSGRTKIADNAREPCWSPGGQQIAFMKGETDRFLYSNFATQGLFIYDLRTGKTRQHPNRELIHLANLNWTSDGMWFIATVHGGLGYAHSNLAIEVTGDRIIDLKLEGCRPNVRRDGRMICWNHGDFAAGVADLDLESWTPKAINVRDVVESTDPTEVYHTNWSPDGRYIAFASGPKLQTKSLMGAMCEFPGVVAPGWNICVADPTQKNHWQQITLDGKSCKFPNWILASDAGAKATR